MKLNMARLAAPGKVTCECDTTLPHDLKLPATFAVRCGLYHPGKGGSRLRLDGPLDGTGRARCGRIVVAKAVGGAMVRWEPEPADPDIAAREARLNLAGEVVDFGPVATSGAFRLRHAAGADWELTPLPASSPFRVELRLDRLGAAGRKARCVMVVGMDGRSIGEAAFRQDGATLSFSHDGKAFAYRIVLGQKIP
jgi:hypothetical protein